MSLMNESSEYSLLSPRTTRDRKLKIGNIEGFGDTKKSSKKGNKSRSKSPRRPRAPSLDQFDVPKERKPKVTFLSPTRSRSKSPLPKRSLPIKTMSLPFMNISDDDSDYERASPESVPPVVPWSDNDGPSGDHQVKTDEFNGGMEHHHKLPHQAHTPEPAPMMSDGDQSQSDLDTSFAEIYSQITQTMPTELPFMSDDEDEKESKPPSLRVPRSLSPFDGMSKSSSDISPTAPSRQTSQQTPEPGLNLSSHQSSSRGLSSSSRHSKSSHHSSSRGLNNSSHHSKGWDSASHHSSSHRQNINTLPPPPPEYSTSSDSDLGIEDMSDIMGAARNYEGIDNGSEFQQPTTLVHHNGHYNRPSSLGTVDETYDQRRASDPDAMQRMDMTKSSTGLIQPFPHSVPRRQFGSIGRNASSSIDEGGPNYTNGGHKEKIPAEFEELQFWGIVLFLTVLGIIFGFVATVVNKD